MLCLVGVFLCIAMSLSVSLSAYAMGRQVYDDAGLFSDEEITELTEAVDEAENETGWDLMLLTVNDTSVVSTQDYG